MSVERFRITATLVGGKSPRADHGDSPELVKKSLLNNLLKGYKNQPSKQL